MENIGDKDRINGFQFDRHVAKTLLSLKLYGSAYPHTAAVVQNIFLIFLLMSYLDAINSRCGTIMSLSGWGGGGVDQARLEWN